MRKLFVCLVILLSLFPAFTESLRVFDGPYLISETDENGNKYTYTYLEGLLLFTTIEDQAGNISSEYYLRDSSDFSLLGVNRGETLTVSESDLPYKGNFTSDKDGNIIYIEEDTVYTYSVTGLVLSKVTESLKTEYEYDENSVVSSITYTSDSEVKKEYYENGKLSSYEKSEGSVLQESGVYTDSGLVKTIYNRGKAVARIYYGKDYVKVQKVEYL